MLIFRYSFLLSLIFLFDSCGKAGKERLNVLLVGNSSIYFNNMPKMIEAISSENGVEINTKLIAYGGYSLQDHLQDGILEKMLDSLDWDFVVLNEQSTLGENYIVNGMPRVKESSLFYNTVRELDSQIKESGAETIIISLYPRKNAPNEDGEMLDYSYMKIAEELNIKLSPVSYTWKEFLAREDSWRLYRDDNLHPTPLGSYITANVLFSTITNIKSKPINKEIFGPLIEEYNGFIHQDSIVSLIKMNWSKSKLIAGLAFENVKKLNEAGGYFILEKPN